MKLTERLLTFDIETAAQKRHFDELPSIVKDNFQSRFHDYPLEHAGWNDLYHEKAPLNPFYGQVVSISFKTSDAEPKKLTLFQTAERDEFLTLWNFCAELHAMPPYNWVLTGHAIKSFDIPFLCTRMLAHGITIPKILLTANAAKDWDNGKAFIDTNLPPFTSYNQRVKLVEWCMLLGIESPKDDLSGADVPAAFWRGEYERIAKYNAKDVDTEEKVAMKLIEAFGLGGER